MTKITYWQCEKCGQIYDTEGFAKECEESHFQPEKIVKCKYNKRGLYQNYPEYIIIKMKNGIEMEYIAMRSPLQREEDES